MHEVQSGLFLLDGREVLSEAVSRDYAAFGEHMDAARCQVV
jgi:hypothetical protein